MKENGLDLNTSLIKSKVYESDFKGKIWRVTTVIVCYVRNVKCSEISFHYLLFNIKELFKMKIVSFMHCIHLLVKNRL